MSTDGSGTAAGIEPRLEDRVVALLSAHDGSLAFNGLRRSLQVHPESLSRALRRLERYGRIARADGGYRLLGPGEAVGDASEAARPALTPEEPAERWTQVAEVGLAPGFDGPQILGLLAGRWAGSLRWVGVYDRASHPLLVWSRTDGPGQVLLGWRDHALRVYAEPEPPGPVPPDLNEAARDLLLFALERLKSFALEPRTPGASAFVLGAPAPALGPN